MVGVSPEPQVLESPGPFWTEKLYRPSGGQDHLGLGSVSSDRILRTLAPGINVLTVHPRYWSFYSFVLDEFWRRRLARTRRSFAGFYRPRESVYAVAAYLCDRPEHEMHGPMRGVVGTDKARPYAAQAPAEFDPMYDYIDSDLGGYGLYYGTTMAATGLVIPALPQAGVPFDAPTPVGQRAAAAFREAIAGTAYYRDYFGHPDRLVPAAVVLEYARAACLCQLQTDDAPDRPLLRDVFCYGGDPEEAALRRSTLRFFLDLSAGTDGVRVDQDTFRRLIYFRDLGGGLRYVPRADVARTARRWRLYQAREYYSLALNRLWALLTAWGAERSAAGAVSVPVADWWEWLDSAMDFGLVGRELGAGDPGIASSAPLADLASWIRTTAGTGADRTRQRWGAGVTRMRVPDLLRGGEWEHALVLTYSLDLSFYERDLGRTLARVPNRVVLADARRLAEHFDDIARGGEGLHGANVAYAVAGLTAARAAHAKVILLAAPGSGLAIVGSGNLTLGGYASQGEQFCVYRYDGALDQLPPFVEIRQLLDGLAARDWIDEVARWHLDQIWAGAPWLGATAPPGAPMPVRHNLDESLLSQLAERIGGRRVGEVVVHAPFYDPECAALGSVLGRIAPSSVRMLVQEHETSVDPDVLARVLSRYPGRAAVHTVSAPEAGTYLHAKFILARTGEEDIVLSGSANMSLSGLCSTAASGNVEVGNLLSGSPGSFDYLLDSLTIGPPADDPAALPVALRPDHGPQPDQVTLRSARWQDGVLTVVSDRDLPIGEHVRLRVGEVISEDAAPDVGGAVAIFRLAGTPAGQALERAVPVALLLRDGDGGWTATTPTWPYHVDALRGRLARSADHKVLLGAGSLPADEEDLLDLLEELQRSLVPDVETAWRLARRDPVPSGRDEETGEPASLADIDFELLRRHPRVAQYLRSGPRRDGSEPTDLQVILSAIASHFAGTSGTVVPQAGTADTGGIEVGRSADDTGQDTEQERRRLSAQARNRLAWQRFIIRYLDGLSDPRFLELAGPVMLARNSAVFNHLLALLLQRGSIRDDFGIAGQLRLWHFLWGQGPDDLGLVGGLDEESSAAVTGIFAEAHTLSMVLAALCWSYRLAQEVAPDGQALALRDFWRHLLTHRQVSIDDDVLLDAASELVLDQADPLAALGEALLELATATTESEMLDSIAAAFASQRTRCRIEKERVIRASPFDDEVKGRQVVAPVLIIDDEHAVADAGHASAALTAWIAAEQREYYRIHLPWQRATAVADPGLGVYWLKTTDNMQRLPEPSGEGPAWLIAAERLSRRLGGAAQAA